MDATRQGTVVMTLIVALTTGPTLPTALPLLFSQKLQRNSVKQVGSSLYR